MELIQQSLELLRRAIKERRVRDHVLDDVEIAVEHLEDAIREWDRTA
jgi:hypothetical protein